ncbi:DivIVA domain-containing protein [Nocardioides donggukensis]|uniref:Cell wall synthesis protein Wag31 n=1 Tax=Nocardioides donggukensis TaxID=2774019 RepID=A0A927PZA6_9ACTN|nr:DivIVA domain-containing protein [Nocardioides donggukensis]MBD8868770.1 DivIVA domain-containing protein [Nocardioides donggukensis]
MSATPSQPAAQSAQQIRHRSFPTRLRGLDAEEVYAYLDRLADQVGRTERELQQLRERSADPDAGVSDRAVVLFSQAQQVADSLIAEAVQSARDLMMSARGQQREILAEARQAAEEVTGSAGGREDPLGGTRHTGYDRPVPEVEYVRTYTQIAQMQLRAVLDALGEQVDRLGELPALDAEQEGTPTGDAILASHSTASGGNVPRPR